ncbi:MAG: UvrD-helicase domain-containing protein [Lachnospiraceae bacterium]|nr:UvrD-helicase domain-containing protein [Lachnospiraceae bacterium]
MLNIDKELNTEQARAVRTTEGPVLILAGAGSGKTRTLIYRIAYLLEKGVRPWNIMALTFTNKAAREMKERVEAMMPDNASSIWISTFHSTCLKVMFQYAERLGYEKNFEIADTSDQKAIMKEVYKKLNLNNKMFPERRALNAISNAKDELKSPTDFARENDGDYSKEWLIKVYREYQASLLKNNSMDFDDLIMNTVSLFKTDPEVLSRYRERFRYLMVDEYQDTNTSQFELISLLAGEHKNLCVVGDDDQSIYRFRGANIYNILDFEKSFPSAAVIRLEENYRSTGNIIKAANAVIAHNTERKKKALWTGKEDGALIRFKMLESAAGEASYIAEDIRSRVSSGKSRYSDFAVLIRTNVQSKELEDAFRVRGIEYDLVKGLRFWDTKIIKDLTSYLLTVAGGANDMRTVRIINLPRRGIGQASVERALAYGAEKKLTLLECCGRASEIPGIPSKTAKAMQEFYDLIISLREDMKGGRLYEAVDRINEKTGYLETALAEAETNEKAEEMREYVNKLKETLDIYERETEEPDLLDFMRQNGLEGNALDKTGDGGNGDQVLIMTMHNAKGLEFPNVFLAGAEDGLFPGYATLNSEDPLAMEEERRLCYVAITRAEKELTITAARYRMINGETRYSEASRFLREIPIGLLDMKIEPGKGRTESRKTGHAREDSSWELAKKSFQAKPQAYSGTFRKRTLTTPAKKPDYEVGDRVRHFKFGEGVVTDIADGGRDYEVTVSFDSAGVKKMFAGFAKLKKL